VEIDDAAEQREQKELERLLDLLASTDRLTRLGGAQELGRLGAPAAVEPLVRTLQATDDLLRTSAARALGRIGDESAVPALKETAVGDPASGVRTTAIDALAGIGDSDGLAMLRQLAIDPLPLIGSAERWFEPRPPFSTRRGELRRTRRWAAKRLRELNVA
jgi:HEAT repeat protein